MRRGIGEGEEEPFCSGRFQSGGMGGRWKVGGKGRKEARRGQIKWVGELWINITRKPVSFGASALVCVVMIIVESRCWYDL